MEEAPKVFFSLVVKKEALSRFRQLADSEGILKFWIRGGGDRFQCKIIKFNQQNLQWDSQFPADQELPEKIYFCFRIGEQDFFGRAYTLRTSENPHWKFQIADNLYKAEKRYAQRLLVYPHKNVDLELPNPLLDKAATEKIISFGRKSSNTQTDLMIKFVDLVGSKNIHQNSSLRVRVVDLSASGLALKAGRDTKDFFSAGATFIGCKLHFEGEVIGPLDIKVSYRNHVKQDVFIGKDYYRIGIQLISISAKDQEGLRDKIESLINMGDATSEFEIFRST